MALSADNVSPTEPFGEWIARERRQRGLSKAALGAAIGYSGSAVFQWEAGVVEPLPRAQAALREFFERNQVPADASETEVTA